MISLQDGEKVVHLEDSLVIMTILMALPPPMRASVIRALLAEGPKAPIIRIDVSRIITPGGGDASRN